MWTKGQARSAAGTLTMSFFHLDEIKEKSCLIIKKMHKSTFICNFSDQTGSLHQLIFLFAAFNLLPTLHDKDNSLSFGWIIIIRLNLMPPEKNCSSVSFCCSWRCSEVYYFNVLNMYANLIQFRFPYYYYFLFWIQISGCSNDETW